MSKILIIVTNVDQYEKVGYRTGLWFSELVHFYDVAEAAGFSLVVASPSGGKVPIDPESLLLSELGDAIGLKSAVSKRYLDRGFMDLLSHSAKVSDLSASEFDAVYLTGGNGVMFDFHSEQMASLIADFYDAGKLVSAVCHGPSGLLDVQLNDGSYLVTDKNLTGFSWQEEILVKRDFAVPYNLEDELQNKGAVYSKSAIPFATHIVEDGNLITGQNPSSAQAVGEAVVKRLVA